MELQAEYVTAAAKAPAVIDRARELETQGQALVERAKAILIDDDDSYRAAVAFLLRVKETRVHVGQLWDPVIRQAHETHRAALASRASLDRPLDEAERVVKPKLAAYDEKRQREAAEARRKAEEEAMRKAEEARRRAEAEAAEARRQAEEARRRREEEDRRAEAARRAAEDAARKAERARSEAARKRAEAEAAEARRQAEEARRRAEAEAAEALRKQREAEEAEGAALAPAAPVAVAPTPEPPRVAGVSYADNWKAEVTDLKALLHGIVAGIVPITAVKPDQAVLDRAAKAMREHMTWPGVRSYMERVTRAGKWRS